MKCLLAIIIFFGCKALPDKSAFPQPAKDSAPGLNVLDDRLPVAFNQEKDTQLLNKIIQEIKNFPEVKFINAQINKKTKGKRGVSFFVRDGLNGNPAFYRFEVGDNSHDDRYENIFDFLYEKKTGLLKLYDHLENTIIDLKSWRFARHQ